VGFFYFFFIFFFFINSLVTFRARMGNEMGPGPQIVSGGDLSTITRESRGCWIQPSGALESSRYARLGAGILGIIHLSRSRSFSSSCCLVCCFSPLLSILLARKELSRDAHSGNVKSVCASGCFLLLPRVWVVYCYAHTRGIIAHSRGCILQPAHKRQLRCRAAAR